MISLSIARKLKEAGLVWPASINDYFAIPDREMDDRVFVVSELLANLSVLRGWPVVTFHGTAEWALDYILTTEVVWLPREDQLRQLLTGFADEPLESMVLTYEQELYRCAVVVAGKTFTAEAVAAEDAYAQILLDLLEQHTRQAGST